MTFWRRAPRGFSIVEASMSASLFLLGVTSIMLFSLYTSHQMSVSTANTQAMKLASRLVEEQALLGYTAQTPRAITGNAYEGGKTLSWRLDVADASGAVTPGSSNLGVPAFHIRASVTWQDHVRAGATVVTRDAYVSP